MKKIISKKDIRHQIEQQIEDFLDDGGEVEQVKRGISGRDCALAPLKPSVGDGVKPEERTYLPDVVATLEARKQRRTKKTTPKKNKHPKKRIIYDDFGEPLRWEWEE